MKTVIGSNIFITKFAYKSVETVVPGTSKVVVQRETVCYIKHSKSRDESEVIVEVSVRTDSRDQFVRAEGRSRAFKKALNTMFASKELREHYAIGNVEYHQFISDFYEQCPNSYFIAGL